LGPGISIVKRRFINWYDTLPTHQRCVKSI